MIRKLKSSKGETITEVLVAALVAALALVLLVSMLTAAQRFVKKSGEVFATNMQVKNSAEYGGADSGDTAATVPLDEEDSHVTVQNGRLQDAGSKDDSDASFSFGGTGGASNRDSITKIPVRKQSDTNEATGKKTVIGYQDP